MALHRTSDLSESRAPAYSCYLCIEFFILFSKKDTIIQHSEFKWRHLDNWMTVWMGYDFAMIWARQRCGDSPKQERHSGRIAKRITFCVELSADNGAMPHPPRRAHWHLCTEWKCHSELKLLLMFASEYSKQKADVISEGKHQSFIILKINLHTNFIKCSVTYSKPKLYVAFYFIGC